MVEPSGWARGKAEPGTVVSTGTVNSLTARGMVVSGTRESGTRGHGMVDSTRRRTGIQKGHPPINGRKNQNKTRIKLDFKTKRPWNFSTAFWLLRRFKSQQQRCWIRLPIPNHENIAVWNHVILQKHRPDSI